MKQMGEQVGMKKGSREESREAHRNVGIQEMETVQPLAARALCIVDGCFTQVPQGVNSFKAGMLRGGS